MLLIQSDCGLPRARFSSAAWSMAHASWLDAARTDLHRRAHASTKPQSLAGISKTWSAAQSWPSEENLCSTLAPRRQRPPRQPRRKRRVRFL